MIHKSNITLPLDECFNVFAALLTDIAKLEYTVLSRHVPEVP